MGFNSGFKGLKFAVSYEIQSKHITNSVGRMQNFLTLYLVILHIN